MYTNFCLFCMISSFRKRKKLRLQTCNVTSFAVILSSVLGKQRNLFLLFTRSKLIKDTTSFDKFIMCCSPNLAGLISNSIFRSCGRFPCNIEILVTVPEKDKYRLHRFQPNYKYSKAWQKFPGKAGYSIFIRKIGLSASSAVVIFLKYLRNKHGHLLN